MLPEQNALSGVKVMVIDDSNTIRRSAEIFLLQAGCTVILAEDGFDALAKIADHQPDLVFVDIMMPRLDGYQTCALIKKNAKFQGTPVVMLSSKDGLFDRARGRMVGSDQYLTKPFTKESLLKAVATHVNRPRRDRRRPPPADAARRRRRHPPHAMTIKKILIVDDSPTERHVLNDMLTKAGYEVVACDNGDDAIAKAKQIDARPHPDGRRDARAQRLPGDARDQPRRGRRSTSRSSCARRRARRPTRSGACARARATTSSSPSTGTSSSRRSPRWADRRDLTSPTTMARPARIDLQLVPAGARDPPRQQDGRAGRIVAARARVRRRAVADPARATPPRWSRCRRSPRCR